MTEFTDKNQNKNYSEENHLRGSQIANNPEKKLEKRVLVFLVIMAVVAIPLGIWQISNTLNEPFQPKVTNATNSLVSVRDTEEIRGLRERDTDQDGLNDYEELYQYKTSPYISDSDSDGIADNIEVEQSTDPNCPEGTDCGRATDSTNTSTGELDVTNLSADQLRQILIDAGAPEDMVNEIDDEDLMASYQEILAEEGDDILNLNSGSTVDTNIAPDSGVLDYGDLDYDALFNLTPSEIRQLLVEGGVPEDILNEYDDETVQAIYLEALYENLGEVETTE